MLLSSSRILDRAERLKGFHALRLLSHSILLPGSKPWQLLHSSLPDFPGQHPQGLGQMNLPRISQGSKMLFLSFLVAQTINKSACDAGDLGLIPGLGRSLGEGNGYPLQYACLGNLVDRGPWLATVHGVTKSWTQLSNYHLNIWASQVVLVVKNLLASAGDVRDMGMIPGSERAPGGGHATHSSILA